MDIRKFVVAITAVVLAGCVSYNNTKVVERPPEPVHAMLILIELPGFSATVQQKDGVAFVNTRAESALEQYKRGFLLAVNRDMARVFQENRIASKIIFIPTQTTDTINPMAAVKPSDRSEWKYALWIRHTKGFTYCQYNSCTAQFQNTAKLMEAASGKLLWEANDTRESPYKSDLYWRQGFMFKDILEALSQDKIIALPASEPNYRTVETPGFDKPYGT
jgi:hypothetical protein